VLHAQAERGGVRHAKPALEAFGEADPLELLRRRHLLRVGVVDTVDRGGLEQDLRADLERALGTDRVGGEVRHAAAGAEDHHTALLQVPDRAPRDVRLGDLAHGDGGLDAGVDASLLQEVLQREAVHDRAEHAHVVGTGVVHPALGQLGAAEVVAAADHDRDLDAGLHDVGDLAGDVRDDLGVDAELAAAEHLAGQLEHDALVRRRLVVGRRQGRDRLGRQSHSPMMIPASRSVVLVRLPGSRT
jgi:hypothetical protein